MKKFLLIIFLVFGLCACKKTVIDEEDDNYTYSTNKLELYSDNEKIVYESNMEYLVFYYSGNKITGFSDYIAYYDNETAKNVVSQIEVTDNMKKVYTKENYVVIEYSEKEYKDLTVNGVKEEYSYLKEVKKGD